MGWVFQFVGHAIEGNSPAFFRNPLYLIVGPVWLVKRALASAGIVKDSSKSETAATTTTTRAS